jgi:hypothetical protein
MSYFNVKTSLGACLEAAVGERRYVADLQLMNGPLVAMFGLGLVLLMREYVCMQFTGLGLSRIIDWLFYRRKTVGLYCIFSYIFGFNFRNVQESFTLKLTFRDLRYLLYGELNTFP